MAIVEPISLVAQGDHVYRVAQPAVALAEDPAWSVVAGPYLDPAIRHAARLADLLVISQVVHLDLVALIRWRRARGRATVFEVNDNFLAMEAGNPQRAFFAAEGNRALALQLAAAADGLQLCSGALADRFAAPGQATAVFPNQLPAPPAPRHRRDDGTVRVGWGGSHAHRPEVALVAAAAARLLQDHPRVSLAFMAPPELLAALGPLPASRCQLVGPGDFAAYRDFIAGLTIGLAPLAAGAYNECRSDTKFLEYASCRVAPVLADHPAYRRTAIPAQAARFFATEAELVAQVGSLVASDGAAWALGNRAAAHVAGQRLQGQHADARRSWYMRLATSVRRQAGPGATATAARAEWDHMPLRGAAWPRANVALVPLQGAARLVALATEVQFQGGEGRRLLDQAVALAPDDPLPRIYRARDPDDLAAAVARAGPEGSPLAHFSLAQRLLPGCAPAVGMLGQSWRLAPGSLVLADALADCLGAAGRPAEARVVAAAAAGQRRRVAAQVERAAGSRAQAPTP